MSPLSIALIEESARVERERDKARRERDTLRDALRELLNYTGGWDLPDEAHPIVQARKALEAVT